MTDSAHNSRFEPTTQLRIGLLSPYRGTNLGDAAIHIALIDNLRRRFESVEIVGINLDPARTSNLHKIRCQPITGLPVASYWRPSSPAPAQHTSGGSEGLDRSRARAYSTLKRTIKATPIVAPLARAMARTVRAVPGWRHELGQLRSSFRLARQLDLLIVAGGGQIDEEWGGPWGHPYVLFRWAMLSRLAGTPMIVLSVGASALPSLLGRSLVGIALASATYRSYRSSESKRLVSGFGFTHRDLCVPDLAFSLATEQYVNQHRPCGGGVVGVSPISYGHPDLSPTPRPEVYDAYLRQLGGFVRGLVTRGFEVVLFNSSGSDRTAIQDLLALINDGVEARAAIGRVRVVFPSDVGGLLTELARVDYVVASRLHGVLLSHVLAKPVVAISFDSKVDAHMRDMGQSKYLSWIETVTTSDLERLFANLECDSEQIRSALVECRESFRHRLTAQYDALATLVSRQAQAARGGPMATQECQSIR